MEGKFDSLGRYDDLSNKFWLTEGYFFMVLEKARNECEEKTFQNKHVVKNLGYNYRLQCNKQQDITRNSKLKKI